MKKVIGYVRVSTEEQNQSGLGIQSQIDKIKAYCNLYDLELIEIIQDAASGKNLNRKGLKRSIAMLTSGKAEGLVIAKLDRLTRSVKDMGTLIEKYFSDKYSLKCVSEQIDTATAAGRMMINILSSVSQWERETISERTKDALSVKKKNNERVGSIPFGQDLIDGKLVDNADEQAVIGLIISLKGKGYSFQMIADKLNADGYLTKTDRQWNKKITNKIYKRVSNEK